MVDFGLLQCRSSLTLSMLLGKDDVRIPQPSSSHVIAIFIRRHLPWSELNKETARRTHASGTYSFPDQTQHSVSASAFERSLCNAIHGFDCVCDEKLSSAGLGFPQTVCCQLVSSFFCATTFSSEDDTNIPGAQSPDGRQRRYNLTESTSLSLEHNPGINKEAESHGVSPERKRSDYQSCFLYGASSPHAPVGTVNRKHFLCVSFISACDERMHTYGASLGFSTLSVGATYCFLPHSALAACGSPLSFGNESVQENKIIKYILMKAVADPPTVCVTVGRTEALLLIIELGARMPVQIVDIGGLLRSK
ncbi:hypothetical protein MJG53_017961 [Ovis ammon polii x Ovis aries]|uniref:Uncharacterized protein n=1 Tax=Ovis ammon polii x Ovis aries TaxID=2918886 RepID=A0ACB9U5K1_9CETA|nr:hypothetical protein MJG53_017961 [Ovis ammon polii x Ovis aries]